MPVQYHYDKFPPENLDWEALSKPLVGAAGALAAYNTFLGLIPNSDILVSPMMQQEAVASNKIEGTQATAGEVFEYQAGNTDVSAALESDIIEIINFSLNREIKRQLSAETASSGVYPVVDKLFFSPIFTVSEFIKIDDVDPQVARRLLHTLEGMNHLVVIRKGSGRRSAMMAFPKLLEITEGLAF